MHVEGMLHSTVNVGLRVVALGVSSLGLGFRVSGGYILSVGLGSCCSRDGSLSLGAGDGLRMNIFLFVAEGGGYPGGMLCLYVMWHEG